VTVYGPRIQVHDDRFGARKSGPNRLLVVHTSEGSEGPTSAENLGAFMTMPGDRLNPDGTRFGASYHYVTDTDRVLPAVPDDVVAYAAAGANNDGIHVCIPGKAGQTRAQWLDATSRSYIRQAVAVMVDKAREHGIPLDLLTVAEIVAGAAGYCGHVDISNAYHRSDHTDPGAQFPWDVLATDIAALTAPEDDDMTPLDIPDRVYDSRVAGGEFSAGEVRKIPVGMCTQAFLHITAVGPGPGFVSISGTDTPSPTSIVNLDTDGVASGGAPIGVPDGNVRVRVSASCHIIVDVFARA